MSAPTDPVADATQDDALIEATDNSGEPGGDVDQSPDLIIVSDTDAPPEVAS